MKIINNLQFYEDCQNALVECFGNEKLAVIYLSNTKYSQHNRLVLEQYVSSINEGLGSKIRNLLSKSLGGSISKIDSVLAKMRNLENEFIERENKLEKEYVDVFRQLVDAKYKTKDASKVGIYQAKLKELEIQLKNMNKLYDLTMDDLEKQINIIVKGSNRKADYYNLKRAKDSAESKTKRAKYKYDIFKYRDSPEMDQFTPFQSYEEVKKEEEEAKQDLQAKESEVTQSTEPTTKPETSVDQPSGDEQSAEQKEESGPKGYEPPSEWKSITFRKYEDKMKDTVIVSGEGRDRVYKIFKDEELNPSTDGKKYNNNRVRFINRRQTCVNQINDRIETIKKMVIDESTDQMKKAAEYYIGELEKIVKQLTDLNFPPPQYPKRSK